MFKTIKSAQIEVVKPSELNIGDYILWSYSKVEVIKVNELNRFITILDPYDNMTKSFYLLSRYYKIISCEEVEENELS